jgi:hypothetical protein
MPSNIKVPQGVMDLLADLDDALAPLFTVTLAGGFLRDTYGDRNIKDVDILVTPTLCLPDGDMSKAVENLTSNLNDGYQTIHTVDGNYLYNMRDRGVVGILMGFSKDLDKEVQLIIYDEPKTPLELAHDMDINICQIVMDVQGTVTVTGAFTSGFENKEIITINQHEPALDEARRRRMKDKYPEFDVVLPANHTLNIARRFLFPF